MSMRSEVARADLSRSGSVSQLGSNAGITLATRPNNIRALDGVPSLFQKSR